MVRERKCILCHIVYSSKKEMDEHMRSMLHHRELENLKGRDSNHECQVCRVTVVGLSAYAKHISSQLHKDGVEAHDAEEEKEKTDEEYFDKELIQLIQQRNEQNWTSEFCHINREAEGDDRRLRRRQNDRLSYQDSYETTSRRHHGPSQRDWNWEKDSFLNSKQGKSIHPSRNSTNSNRHLSSQREQLGWHQNASRGPPSRYHNYGNAGGIWHQKDRGATSDWHHHDRGRNSNWSSEANNVFSNWQSKNVGGHWKSAQQNGNGWNTGRNRAVNISSQVDNMDTSWLKINSVQDKYSSENCTWQWQKGVENYTGLDHKNGNPDCLLDFTSDQLPSDQLLNFSFSEHSQSKNSKVSRKSSSPSREKTSRWAPYPSQKTVEQQPLSEDVAKTSEKALSRLSSETADPKTSNPKVRKRESYSISSTNSKASPKVAPCKVPVACTSENKSSKSESKNRKMPSLKSPLLAIPVIISSPRRSSKGLLKNAHVSSSSGEVQSQLSPEISNSLNKSKLNNNSCNYSSLKGNTPLFNSNESLNKALEKAKDEPQHSYSFQKSRSSSSGDAQSDWKEEQKTEVSSHDLKIHEVQTKGIENTNNENKPGSINTPSNSYSSFGLADLDHIAVKNDNCLDELNGANKKHIELRKETPDSLSNYPCELDIELKTTLEQNGDEDITKSNDAVEKEDEGDHSNHELLKGTTGPLLPELSKLGFPASLQRDLTWRTSLKNKISSHLPEPNLNNARRIRNVSGHRKNETEKESGLKPTLRQIISVSRRSVNWEQVIQQVSKKKQEQGKGLPRFGIEMVPLIQNEQGLELDEDVDLTSLEGFQWEGISIGSPGTVRKRSLSESSVAVDKTASIYSFFNNQGTSKEDKLKKSGSVANSEDITSRIEMLEDTVVTVKQESSSLPSSPFKSDRIDLTSSERKLNLKTTPDIPIFSTSEVQRNLDSIVHPSVNKGTLESAEEHSTLVSGLVDIGTLDAATDSSYTSSNEQNDSQGMRKKRRATGEGSCPEIPSLERKTKRRKIKGKKERSQVDQLLVISLREEELSKSLPCVDESLLQARAALQAAYIEVQRLLVLKQQIAVEMGSLRTQRIQILQGLQETYEPSDQLQSQQPHHSSSSEKSPGKVHLIQDPTTNAGLLAPLLDAVPPISAQIPPSSAAPVQEKAESTFQTAGDVAPITVPDSSIQIKQEAVSPKLREDFMNVLEQNTPRFPQAELHLQDRNTSQQPSLYPVITASMSLSELIDFQKANQDIQKSIPNMMGTRLSGHSSPTNSGSVSSVKTQGKISPVGNTISGPCTGSFESQSCTSELAANENNKQPTEQPEQMAFSTMVSMEFKVSKKKKLKKKKALRAARVPENSDTEQDVCDSKPIRKVKTVKIPKGGKVTTSIPPKQVDSVAAQERKRKNEENDSDTSLEFVEVPKSPLEVVAINSSESEREKPDSPSKRDTLSSTEKLLRESSRSGYNEVSSTSEIGVNYKDGIGRSVAETQTPILSLRGSKTSSEVSSEPGEDEDPTEGTFEGHSASVNAIQIFGNVLYTCSADKTVRAYNLVNRKCVGVFEGHTSKVNCLLVIQTTGKNAALYSGSSDHNINCYNIKTRELIDQFKLDERVLCLHSRWRILYAGLANGNVVTFNIKNNRQLETFECHGPRAISCLATAQEGARRLLIVGSYDCTISVRDARNGLLLRTLEGHSKTVLCMKVVNDLVFSGSSDQSVHAHNIHTGELVRIYKGHNHAVTVVNILGKVMVTACLDKCVRVYELQSHDRLQVYGGHSDMIMCMTIHKSMIYTGCYDGSIQAVRLNLMQNYRCWWHGCSLIFGVVDHLKQHLLNDHTNPNFQTLKCRWKNCDAFFTSRKSSKQDAVGHIEKHAEDDSKIDS
ncbi:zinc finger protein 106 isoform X1 [Pseudonaja textilis]|uniref:Zinc finger protein 106 n=1 Tax=Pseudonaja textilis TaxID=8673 RepID=A0A670XZL5_PSETE|nr:zinc finger protein 106 isoform X1 [Pseudonaja textilis]XP_026565362.1 zinc finger protein 106 isoform X1 [Pseudonaja textilis]XP_026565370.1 zinc finger protein 106 isoform X1 [Pseudonaja textilis]XP_026565379.1 zinc finger protein 106 isoform X1 [Pseudonaja textilis]